MDWDFVVEELYGAPPEGFVPLRTAKVAEAKAAKDSDLAKRIGKLRRPTRSAWLVNRLARERPDEVGSLLDLGPAFAEAMQHPTAEGLRRLSAARQQAVDALVRLAAENADQAGSPTTEAVRREVADTLQAALADPDVADQVRGGRVVEAVQYSGFGLGDLAVAAPAPPAGQAPERPTGAKPDKEEAERARRRAEAQAVLDQAEVQLQATEADVDEARKRAAGLSAQVSRLRAELRHTESQLDQAKDALRQAQDERTRLATAVEQAQAALEGRS